MNFSAWILISVLSASICTVTISGESINSKRKSSKKEDKQLFIDDTEGSGFEPDTKTDMVYSGSGYGPDDEDAPINPPTDVLTRNGNQGSFNEKGGASIANNNDNDGKESKHEQTLPMPTPKSTATPSTTTREPEPPSIDISKPEEPRQEIAPKVPVEKPSEPKTDIADKSPVDDSINNNNNGVYVVNTPNADRTTSFFAQPGILAAVIGGAVVGLLCAILVVMFIVYRMRKKDEGSYPLEDMKRCPATNPYIKPNHREFFA